MIRRPPRSTLTDTLFPYTTLVRSADQINTADMRIEIDADAWPVKACRHLLDVRGLARAVIALHHDAAIMCKACQDRERGVRIEQVGRIDIGPALVSLRKGGDFQVNVDPECRAGDRKRGVEGKEGSVLDMHGG